MGDPMESEQPDSQTGRSPDAAGPPAAETGATEPTAVRPAAKAGVSEPAPAAAAAEGGVREPSSVPALEARTISRKRWVGINALIVVTTVLLIIGMFATYANRLLFSPDNWANTSTQLLQNDNVRSTTANYVVQQIYANVDVAALLKQGLPAQFQGLAGPAAGALQNAAVQGVDTLLTRPRIQGLWAQANRAAAQTFDNIVEGRKGAVKINNGVVSLNLSSIVDAIAAQLGLPSNLGAKLPKNVANLTVFKSDQLKLVQKAGNAIKKLALWLTIIVPLLFALAIYLARGRRRRTLMIIGLAGVLAGVIVLFAQSLLESQVPGSLTHDASLQATIKDVVRIATQLLNQVAGAVIFIGAILAFLAWFAGPARPFRATRRAMAAFLRDNPWGTFGVTLGLLALLFIWDPIPATGKPIGILVFTVLALFGTEVLRRQTAEEFPDARPGDASRAIRARIASIQQRRAQSKAPTAPPGASTVDHLRQLSDLRDHGAITPDEYEAAKSQLLGV
jgi:Short C-terminal domain